MTFPFVWPTKQPTNWLTLLDLQLRLCLLKLRVAAAGALLAFEFIYCVECWLLKMHSTVICIKYTYECFSLHTARLVYPFFSPFPIGPRPSLILIWSIVRGIRINLPFCIAFGGFQYFCTDLEQHFSIPAETQTVHNFYTLAAQAARNSLGQFI